MSLSTTAESPSWHVTAGRLLIGSTSLALGLVILAQALDAMGHLHLGWPDWRPSLYGFLAWSVCLGYGLVLSRGEAGRRALFVLPAALFVLAMAIFPTLFGLSVAFTDWNLSAAAGQHFNGLDNLVHLATDANVLNAFGNMAFYVAAIGFEYAIAFGLALLLDAQIAGRRFWRVIFLLPFMLSPVAVSWMIGKSMLEYRFGPVARFARWLGWDTPSFFASPWSARLTIEAIDAWVSIPFLMILLLAGLQAMPREVQEAARVDGATGWQNFRHIVFPLMLPVSITAVILRVIFKLKLADIVINVTSGGPGGATDTMSSFIYREYRDRSNVGYGTMIAMVYLVVILLFVGGLLRLASRRLGRARA
jgi:multiple sugar transport system permease protein